MRNSMGLFTLFGRSQGMLFMRFHRFGAALSLILLFLTTGFSEARIEGQGINIDYFGETTPQLYSPLVSSENIIIETRNERVDILDITDPLNPTVVGSVEDPVGHTHAMSGDLLASWWGDQFHLIDISDPTSPAHMGSITQSRIWKFDLTGDLLLSLTNYVLSVYDVSDPANATLASEVTFESFSGYTDHHITAWGQWVAVSVGGTGFFIMDLSDPSSPETIATLPLGERGSKPQIVGTRMCMTSDDELRVYDVADPASPALLWSYANLDGGDYSALASWGPTVIAERLNGELHIFNVAADPPSLQRSLDRPFNISSIAFAGSTVYLGDYRRREIWNISEDEAPVLLKQVRVPSSPRDMIFVGDSIVVADTGILVIDPADPPRLDLTWSFESEFGTNGVDSSGELIVSVHDNGMGVTSIADPSSFEVLAFDSSLYGSGIVLSGDRAYIRRYRELLTVDLSDPTSPEVVSSHMFNRYVTEFDAVDDLLLVALTSYTSWGTKIGESVLMDMSDPSTPIELARRSGAVSEVEMEGDIAAMVDDGRLWIYDVSDPTVFSFLATHSPEDSVGLIEMAGEMLALRTYPGFEVLDLSTPSSPEVVGRFVWRETSKIRGLRTMALQDGRVAIGASGAVALFDLNPPDTLIPPVPLHPGTLDAPGPMRGNSDETFFWNAYGIDRTHTLTVYNDTLGTIAHQTEGLTGTSHTVDWRELPGGYRYRWEMTSSEGSDESDVSDTLHFRHHLDPPNSMTPGIQYPSYRFDEPGPARLVDTPTPLLRWFTGDGVSSEIVVRNYPEQEIIHTVSGLPSTEWRLPEGLVSPGGRFVWDVTVQRHEFVSETSPRMRVEWQPFIDQDLNFFDVARTASFNEYSTEMLMAADMNGDFIPDLMTYRWPNLKTHFLNVSGEFEEGGSLSLENSLTDFALSDFDGDSDVDLIQLYQGNEEVSENPNSRVLLYRNLGTGEFATPEVVLENVLQVPNGIAAIDFDGDGDIDLAISKRYAFNFSILFNRGDGTFGEPHDVDSEGRAFDVLVGDVDGNGTNDVVIEDREGWKFRYTLNPIDVGSIASGELSVPNYPEGSALADFDGVGGLDLVAHWAASKEVMIRLNPTEPGEWIVRHLPRTPLDMAVIDLDMNGWVEPVFSLEGNLLMTVPNLGDGQFASPEYYHLRGSRLLVTADFNFDGVEDLATQAASSRVVALMLSDGERRQLPPRAHLFDPLIRGAALEDLDGDSALDLVMVTTDRPGLIVSRNHGRVRFEPGRFDIRGYSAMTTGDFDGDGDRDVVARSNGSYSADLSLLVNDGLGRFSWVDWIYSGRFHQGPRSLAAGDVNGDGLDDVFVAGGTRYNRLLLSTGGGSTWADVFSSKLSSYAVEMADLNGDGHQDLVCSGRVLFGDGAGGFPEAGEEIGIYGDLYDACDIDADGDLDLVITKSANVMSYLNDGAGVFTLGHESTMTTLYGANDCDIATGDLNDDGHLDVISFGNYSGSHPYNSGIGVALGDGAGLFTPVGQLIGVDTARVGALGDVDGDSDLDIIAVHQDGAVSIILNRTHDPLPVPAALELF